MLFNRRDYSYREENKLSDAEIIAYEEFINKERISGEEFVRYISTPLKKNSALQLCLSEKKAQGYFLKEISVEDLMEEKNKVKKELKYYDRVFIKKVGKSPSNREKEPLK